MKKTLKILSILVLIISFIIPNIKNKNLMTNISYAADNKVYSVPIELWHSENTGRLSMGSRALGSIATVEELENGTSNVTVQFVPMDFMQMHGHLLSMRVYSAPLFSGNLTPATVTSTYQDVDLNGGQSTFPGKLLFNYGSQKFDKIGISVSVDAMDQIMGGDASQNAILKFFWNEAKQISGPTASDTKEQKSNEAKSSEEKKSEENKNSEEKKSDENKNSEEKKSDPDKAPEGFVAKKLEDFFKEDTKTKKTGIYNIDITAAYLNPLTGITADGGTKNAAIGEGMSQGVISPVNSANNISDALKNQKASGEKRWSKAMLQRTKDGKLYATVRIHLMNWVKRSSEQGPFIKILQENGDFKLVEAKETKVNIEQYKDSYADYRFEVPHENFIAMIQMFVEPMNRPVRFFVEVNPETINEGNPGDMVVIEEKSNSIYYIFSGIFVIIILAIGFILFNKKKKKNINNEEVNNEK